MATPVHSVSFYIKAIIHWYPLRYAGRGSPTSHQAQCLWRFIFVSNLCLVQTWKLLLKTMITTLCSWKIPVEKSVWCGLDFQNNPSSPPYPILILMYCEYLGLDLPSTNYTSACHVPTYPYSKMLLVPCRSPSRCPWYFTSRCGTACPMHPLGPRYGGHRWPWSLLFRYRGCRHMFEGLEWSMGRPRMIMRSWACSAHASQALIVCIIFTLYSPFYYYFFCAKYLPGLCCRYL